MKLSAYLRLCVSILPCLSWFSFHAVADDAEEMQSGEMNPGTTLYSHQRLNGGDFKVLVYGNSIALHGAHPEIGWTGDWGMAASARENDFAHLTIAALEERRGESADYRIRNLALLERNFTTNLAEFAELADDIAWAPDYVVIAIGENVPTPSDSESVAAYTEFLRSLARPLAESVGRPVVVMRSPFWRNETKAMCTAQVARNVGAIYVDAGALGDNDENKAFGLFSHSGIANHPGDLGMRRLANLILDGIDAAETGYSDFILTPGWNTATASRRNTSLSRSSGVAIATGAIRSVSSAPTLEARYRTIDESDGIGLHTDRRFGTSLNIR